MTATPCGSEGFEGLDSVHFHGLCGLECHGGEEDEVPYDQNTRGLQSLKDFSCAVTSTWVNADDPGQCHTWRGWGSRIRKKQTVFFKGPRDLQCTTWCFNGTKFRTCDHIPVVVKSEGIELRVKKGKNGWAGWIPKSEGKK